MKKIIGLGVLITALALSGCGEIEIVNSNPTPDTMPAYIYTCEEFMIIGKTNGKLADTAIEDNNDTQAFEYIGKSLDAYTAAKEVCPAELQDIIEVKIAELIL